jgi:hypothetical protein
MLICLLCLAIREDRTRGGRSTYQCSYTLPSSLLPPTSNDQTTGKMPASSHVASTSSQVCSLTIQK